MDQPDYKLLEKLAKACRKSGIKTFKGYGIEFTLEEAPAKRPYTRKNKENQVVTDSDEIKSDVLPQDALLFWSVTDATQEEKIEKQDN